eukprot:scaffold246337_cov35-Tisochrysis_lutea.AAC.1
MVLPKPAAASVDQPSFSPRVRSIWSPARIMMPLSAMPNPTNGMALARASLASCTRQGGTALHPTVQSGLLHQPPRIRPASARRASSIVQTGEVPAGASFRLAPRLVRQLSLTLAQRVDDVHGVYYYY